MTGDPIPLGPFDLVRRIGRGGMADVWAGEHRAQKVPVAVKVITAAHSRERRFREAFRREVRAVARLDHPGVVLVLDHGIVPEPTAAASAGRLTSGATYLAMELASWGSLDEVDLPLRWGDLYPILLALLDALAHAHARGVIHRDIKPGNVLMAAPWDARPGVKLTDFGIAHALDSEAGDEYAASGTPTFMAPEQFMGHWRDYGPWTDLYAVGCVTHVLATGAMPFQGKNLAQLAYDHSSRPPPPLPDEISAPAALQGWIWRCMQKRPEHRFQRAADAAWALKSLEEARRARHAAPPPTPAPSLSVSTRAPTEDAPASGAPWGPRVADVLDDDETEVTAPGPTLLTPPPGSLGPPAPTPRRLRHSTVTASASAGPGALGAAVPTHLGAPRALELRTVVHETQIGDALPFADLSPAAETAREGDGDLAPRLRPPLPESWARPETPAPIRLVGAGLSLFGLRTLPLVDRTSERDTLWNALSHTRFHQSCQVRLLRGQAGHGKSRLVEWISERADEVGSAHVLRATHGPTGGPSHGLPRMVARWLRAVDLPKDQLLERTERLLRAQGVTDAYEWTALAELVLPTEDDAPAPVRFSNATERHVLVQRLIERLSQQRPALLWLEDAQWGADSLAFLTHLVRAQRSRPHPILVLATIREEALAERPVERRAIERLLEEDAVSDLSVSPLAPADQRALVAELLRLDQQLAADVADRTDGNPLFAIQLVGDWVERGVLEVGREGFVLQPGERAVLPDDIHAVWTQRLARVLDPLPSSARRALEIAATLGPTVDAAEWNGACAQAATAVAPLLVIALMENRLALPADGGWAFTHGMLRESLERSARESGRLAGYHAACARMLRAHYGDAPGAAILERVAEHRVAAGDAAGSLHPLRAAAEARLSTSEFAQALSLVDRRDAVLDDLETDADDLRRAEGWILRARAHALRGHYEEAARWSEQAVSHARRLGWPSVLPDALLAQATVAHARGDQGVALNALDEARRLYTGLGDRRGVARCLAGRGEAVYRLGDLARAERYLSDGLAMYEADGDPHGTAQALLRLGVVSLWRGDLDGARALLERQLRTLDGSGDRFQVARGTAALGEVARRAGDLDEAERLYREALAIDEAIGSRNDWMDRLNLGLVLLARGDFAAAGDLSARVADDLGPHAEPAQRCAVLVQRLPSVADTRDFARWDHAFREARELLEETGLTDGDVAWLLQLAGDRARARGARARARAAWQLAARQWRGLGRPDLAAEAEARVAEANTPRKPKG